MKEKTGTLYRIASAKENRPKIVSMIAQYKCNAQGSADLKHCAACLAHDFFKLTDKQWNGPAGCEYYAAMLTTIVHFDLYHGVPA